MISGSCLCGNASTKTIQCEEMVTYDDGNHLLEVFCLHAEKDLIPHLSFVTNTKVDKVVEGGKEDTWVLAIILLCFSILCLTAGVVRVVCLNKRTKSREQMVRNIQESLAKKASVLSPSSNEVPNIHQECDYDKNSVIEWSIKL